MKISLIENGLDSLTKGFQFLKEYEEIEKDKATEKKRFSVLKDAILSIQHGIEILFKYLLKEKNEILLFSEVSPKLKLAYQSRKKGEIAELFEAEGVHTVSFRESVDRVNHILGIEIEDKLGKILIKIEKWRNGITHSAVLLNENEVSSVLFDAMERLDRFFGSTIGKSYQSGQGRQDLDRAYNLFKAVHGSHNNVIKEGIVRRLISSLSENGVRKVTSPGVFKVTTAEIAFSILKDIQGDDSKYGCDLANAHCSGNAHITSLSNNEMTISCKDIGTDYRFQFAGMLVYVPTIEGDASPLIFLYSNETLTAGNDPKINDFNGFKTQKGVVIHDPYTEIWSGDKLSDFFDEIDDEGLEDKPCYTNVCMLLSQGMICFLNVQSLEHGNAKRLLYQKEDANGINVLFDAFNKLISR